jgi:L-asparaginase
METVETVCRRIPVVATCRPERGAILYETYGFRGSERDLHASGAISAGRLSPAAARIALIAALGSDLGGATLRDVFADVDA